MSRLTRRGFMQNTMAATAAMTLPTAKVLGANDRINLGMIGLGGRGSEHCNWFGKIEGVHIAALAEPDKGRLGAVNKKHADAKAYTDLRRLIDDKDVHAVVIATCNHWHCLAAVWAVQAGKDVYVEKPMGHNHFEERQLVAAARRHNRIVQLGTQQRSDPVQEQIKQFLYDEKAIGKVQYIRANRYGVRGPIGKRPEPLKIGDNIDYDLWLGPAADEPLYRNQLQYDWHWDWNTGNGEMGNWGVHILDDVRNVGLRDEGGLPQRILAGGGRIAWDDAGNTPNVHFVYYDSGTVPVLFDLTNLPTEPGKNQSPHYLGTRSGYVVHCEGGYYAGGRGGGAAYDKEGKRIKRFSGDGGGGHAANFIAAVRDRKPSILKAEVELGHHSSAWCNFANVAYQVGSGFSREQAIEINKDYKPWTEMLEFVKEHYAAHGVDLTSPQIKLSPVLEFDAKSQAFAGPVAARANALLTRAYRKKEFAMPQEV